MTELKFRYVIAIGHRTYLKIDLSMHANWHVSNERENCGTGVRVMIIMLCNSSSTHLTIPSTLCWCVELLTGCDLSSADDDAPQVLVLYPQIMYNS